MNFSCPSCNSLIVVMPGDRPPPWCSKCGADFKLDDPRFVAMSESPESDRSPAPPPPPPAPSKPWSKRPATETEIEETGEPLAEPTPAPAGDPALAPTIIFMKVGGILLVGLALLFAGEAWTFAKNARTTDGQVVTVWRAESLAFAMYRAELVIEYEANGAKHQISAGRRDEGDRVPLMYDPADPQSARVTTPGSLYRWPLLLGAGGFMLLLSSLVLGALAAHQSAEKPPAPAAPRDPDE